MTTLAEKATFCVPLAVTTHFAVALSQGAGLWQWVQSALEWHKDCTQQQALTDRAVVDTQRLKQLKGLKG